MKDVREKILVSTLIIILAVTLNVVLLGREGRTNEIRTNFSALTRNIVDVQDGANTSAPTPTQAQKCSASYHIPGHTWKYSYTTKMEIKAIVFTMQVHIVLIVVD